MGGERNSPSERMDNGAHISIKGWLALATHTHGANHENCYGEFDNANSLQHWDSGDGL